MNLLIVRMKIITTFGVLLIKLLVFSLRNLSLHFKESYENFNSIFNNVSLQVDIFCSCNQGSKNKNGFGVQYDMHVAPQVNGLIQTKQQLSSHWNVRQINFNLFF